MQLNQTRHTDRSLALFSYRIKAKRFQRKEKYLSVRVSAAHDCLSTTKLIAKSLYQQDENLLIVGFPLYIALVMSYSVHKQWMSMSLLIFSLLWLHGSYKYDGNIFKSMSELNYFKYLRLLVSEMTIELFFTMTQTFAVKKWRNQNQYNVT